MGKEIRICFRVNQKFFEEYIDQPRKEGGYDYLSPFMRQALVKQKARWVNKLSLSGEQSLRQLCTDLELVKISLSDAVLRTYDLANKPDGNEFRKLSDKVDQVLTRISKKLQP